MAAQVAGEEPAVVPSLGPCEGGPGVLLGRGRLGLERDDRHALAAVLGGEQPAGDLAAPGHAEGHHVAGL